MRTKNIEVFNLDVDTIAEVWEKFFSTILKKRIEDFLAYYPDKKSFYIDYREMELFSPVLIDALEANPDLVLELAKEELKKHGVDLGLEDFEPNIRLKNWPDRNLLIQNIKSENIDGLVTFKALITKRTEVLHRVEKAVLRCSLCNSTQKFHVLKNTELPVRCDVCKKPALQLDEKSSNFIDLQRAEAQEILERVRGGTPAAKIELIFEDDLVNTINPGDNVIVTGIMRIRPVINLRKGKKTNNYTKYVEVINFSHTQKDFEEIEISEDDEKEILALARDPRIVEKITKSIAPMIYGHEEVKLAIALQLFGGTKDKDVLGTKMREDIHLLLIGDPGTAKTRFLQQVEQIAPKCIFVSGKSITGVGLTASAERDELSEGGWTLKAGALVLASGGIACIDEFDKIDENERAAMHEVMESQSVSIAKAGIVAKFKAKTAILAAANPKRGRFDPNKPPADQFDIPPTILSRFDLIFPVIDVMDEQKDSTLAEFILKRHQLGAEAIPEKYSEITDDDIISPEILRKYIAYMRKNVRPVLSEEAMKIIRDYYVELRKIGKSQGAVPITPRQIEGLIRLSEASAKLRMSKIVEESDAKRAISLMDFVLNRILVDRETGRIDIDMITIGKPKSMLDKYNIIIEIARELFTKFNEIDEKQLIKTAEERYSIDSSTTRKIIDDLEKKGELYMVTYGKYRLVDQA
ncbi:MAG: minichromosome maintenance protein MCM [Candidatus Micrarchaeota archaeon]|nr:minichromosome maintenance protein MCM [Candidatus Micrarchaeota archaeon]